MTCDETIARLERDLKDRYPRARVTVMENGDGVTVAVGQPNDSFMFKTDKARIRGGSAVLGRILGRCADRPLPNSHWIG